MRKANLRALFCQVGELNERELDGLFDAVQKRQSAALVSSGDSHLALSLRAILA